MVTLAPYVVAASFSVLSAEREQPKGLKFLPAPGTEPVELKFMPTRKSESYSYSGERQVAFFRERVNPESGDVVREPISSALLPASDGEWLVVFYKDVRGKWHTAVIPSDQITMPSNSLSFYNITQVTMKGRFGDTILALEPGLSEAIPTDKFLDRVGNFSVTTINPETLEKSEKTYSSRDDSIPVLVVWGDPDDYEILYRSRVTLAPDNRYLLLLLPSSSARPDQLRTKLISDYVLPTGIQ